MQNNSYFDHNKRNPKEFLRHFVTINEAWIHCYTPETNEQLRKETCFKNGEFLGSPIARTSDNRHFLCRFDIELQKEKNPFEKSNEEWEVTTLLDKDNELKGDYLEKYSLKPLPNFY